MNFNDLIWEENFSCLTLTGQGVRNFLHGQTTANIKKAAPNEFIRCCWLSTKGQIRCLVEILLNENGADILVLSGDINDLSEGFKRVIFPADKVKIESIKLIKRVQKLSLDKSWKQLDANWVSREESCPDQFKYLNKATIEEYSKWRFLQGYIFEPGPINIDINPFEIGISDLISSDKGCYLGQETMARIMKNSSVIKEIRYWECKDYVPNEKQILIQRDSSSENHPKNAGYIISSINLRDGNSCGLAMIRSNYLKETQLFTSDQVKIISISVPIGFSSLTDKN